MFLHICVSTRPRPLAGRSLEARRNSSHDGSLTISDTFGDMERLGRLREEGV